MNAMLARIAAEARAAGRCTDCAICGRPFNLVRKPRAWGVYGDQAQCPGIAVVYLLCGKCVHQPLDERATHVMRLAEGPLRRAYLAMAPAKGTA